MRTLLITILITLASSATAATPNAARIDASSDMAAERSYARMLRESSPQVQKSLRTAVIRINLEDAKTTEEVAGSPALQTISIARVKSKVAGMTAGEVIARGARSVVGATIKP